MANQNSRLGSQKPTQIRPAFRKTLLGVESLERRQLMASDSNAGIGLLGQYYDNSDLSGLVLSRVDANINFNWGTASPAGSVGADTFSVRWSGQVEAVYTELYSFIVNADDGVRLWVDGQLLVDRWTSSPVVNASGSIALVAGRKYDLQLEYFENTNSASVSLEWSSASQAREIIPSPRLFPAELGSVLKETWNGVSGSSISSLTSWNSFPNSPSSSVSLNAFETATNAGDSYGERLRGYLHPPTTGEYTFYVAGDDTAELWLSNSVDAIHKQLIASVPSATLAREWNKFLSQRSAVVNLVAGQNYYIEALHKEGSGADHLAVGWTRPNQTAIEVIDGQYLSPVLPTVSMFSETPTASEGVGGAGRVKVVRSSTSTVNPLTVAYSLRGTAVNGTDYNTLSGTVIIAAGQSSANIDFTAINDAITEGAEIATIELLDAAGYEVDRLSQRTVNITIQDDVNAPVSGSSVIAGTALSNFAYFGGTYSTVTDPTYGSVIQAAITTQPSGVSNAQLRQLISGPVKSGDILFFEFYVRSVGASGRVTAVFEVNGSPYTKSLSQGISATQTWTRVQLPFVSVGDYLAGQAVVSFQLGAQIQTLQFFGFQLLNYGVTSKLEPSTITLQNIGGTYGTMQTVSVTGQSFTTANQIDTITTPANSFRLQGNAKSAAPVVTGDVLQYEFWARGVAGTTPRISAVLQEAYGSFVTLKSNLINLTSGWQKYTYTFTTTKDYISNALQITFNAGYTAPQSVQIGGFTWRNTTRGVVLDSLPSRIPSVNYEGRSGTDAWRTDAETRISQNRMGNVSVQVVDSNGTLVDGAVVQLKQKKQAFKFGTAISGFENLLSSTGGPNALKYQSEIKRLFNTVVLENNLKWPFFLSNRQLGIDSANWAVANSLYFRGHNIVWPSRSNMPSSVWTQYDSLLASQGATAAADYLRTTVRARVTDAASTFNGIAGEWDVVNEPYTNHDVMDILGNDEMLEWYRLFRTLDPTGKRALNDYAIFSNNGGNTSHRTNFDYWLGRLTSQSLVETIGEQSHYDDANLTDMLVLGQLLQSYNTTYNLPIAITEFDVDSQNEQLQADYLRDYMTMSFSQPAVSEFVQWGFWQGRHYQPSAALYRDDFSIKPNGQAYEDLVFGDWWSNARGTTRSGQVQSKVFTGDFDVIVSWNGQTVSTSTIVGTAGTSVNVALPTFHVPTDIALSNATVVENNAANAFVGVLTTTDSDVIDTFSYALVTGTGSDDNADFQLVGNSLKVNPSLDFETKRVYSVRIRSTDQTGLATEKSFTIYVKNLLESDGASTDVMVPLYSYPTFTDFNRTQLSGWWQDIFTAAATTQPITVIINPNSGPIDPQTTTLVPQYQDYIAAIRLLRANPNVRILGYLPTGYGTRTLTQINQFLDWYSTGYKDTSSGSLIDGVFLDEYSNDLTTLAYYRSVRDTIRSRSALANNLIVGNTGVPVANSIFYTEPLADVFVSYEEVETPITGTVFSATTVPTNPAPGMSFAAIVHSVPSQTDMRRVMKSAKSKGYGYVFVTSDILSNPYDVEPIYWSNLLLETHRPVIQSKLLSITENAVLGTTVGNVFAFDPDFGDTLSFAITQGNLGNVFAISPSGVITVNGPLDFETTPSYQLSVQATDSSGLLLSDIANVTISIINVAESLIANRQIFYNRSTSTVFGDGTGNPINAIDTTKSALLPGQTASFANYTNYSRGLNGIVIDVANLVGTPTTADFQFATWDGIAAVGFTAPAAVPTISVLAGVGASGSSRIKIEFADNAIQNTWLRVTMLANANTGLPSNDVFYFGNAIGDMNSGNVGTPTTVRTNATDTSIVRQNQSISANSFGVTSIHDLNKDGRVNATDTSIVRQNQSASIIRFFTSPASFLAADAEQAIDSVMADSSWLDGLDPFSSKRRAERLLR